MQHLNEQKVITLAEAAVSAYEFVLTHHKVFSHELTPNIPSSTERFVGEESLSPKFSRSWKSGARPKMNGRNPAHQGDRLACFYCMDPGHLISECKEWNKKNAAGKAKGVALAQTLPGLRGAETSYEPFMLNGQVSLSGSQCKLISML